MRLQDRLPDSVEVDGRRVPLDLDFRNVLRLMETLDDKTLLPDAREYLALKCVTKRPRNVHNTLMAVKGLLFQPHKRDGEPHEKITDFVQDAAMIRAAFMQVYGINLWTARLHWLEFIDLLHNLPEGNRYTDTVAIRARPVPTPTKYNQKEREWLMEAKAAVALEMTEEEKQTRYQNEVRGVFSGLMGLIKDGDASA